jgi:hypothetical protein
MLASILLHELSETYIFRIDLQSWFVELYFRDFLPRKSWLKSMKGRNVVDIQKSWFPNVRSIKISIFMELEKLLRRDRRTNINETNSIETQKSVTLST